MNMKVSYWAFFQKLDYISFDFNNLLDDMYKKNTHHKITASLVFMTPCITIKAADSNYKNNKKKKKESNDSALAYCSASFLLAFQPCTFFLSFSFLARHWENRLC